MEIRGATLETIETAARKAGVLLAGGGWGRPSDWRPLNRRGDGWAGRLKPDPANRLDGHPKAPPVFSRRAQGSGSVLGGCLCWHGHRAFLRALFALAPAATVRTVAAHYKGQAHFEASHGATGYRNIGSQVRPVSMADACVCEDQVSRGPRGGLRLSPGFTGSDPPEWKTQRAARKARSLTPPGHLRAVSIETATQAYPDGDLTA